MIAKKRILKKKKKWQGVTQNCCSWSRSRRRKRRRTRRKRRRGRRWRRRRRRRRIRRTTTVGLWCCDESNQFWMYRLHKSIGSQQSTAMHNDAAMCAWAKYRVNKWVRGRKKTKRKSRPRHQQTPHRFDDTNSRLTYPAVSGRFSLVESHRFLSPISLGFWLSKKNINELYIVNQADVNLTVTRSWEREKEKLNWADSMIAHIITH